jgi:hypothetical protein
MWFEALMGFSEHSPEQVRSLVEVDGEFLRSRVNGRRVRFGQLTTPSLTELRRDAPPAGSMAARVSEVVGDVRALHAAPENTGALFQAASQFNLLEMASPSVVPEAGVGIYEHDGTQGPACAVACGGGTIYRNYLAPVGNGLGQTAERQIDCLADLGTELGDPLPWVMTNGYALATAEGLARVNAELRSASEERLDALRGALRIGVQHDVEVIDAGHSVTQVYGSALPVAYGGPPAPAWERLARLVLEASYEATVLVARILRIERIFLTRLGGGVFGNDDRWINDAIVRAMDHARGLEVRLVSFGRSRFQGLPFRGIV